MAHASARVSAAPVMASGDPDAWRTATFALIAIIVVGAFVLVRDRRPMTIALFGLAGAVVVGLAVAQARFAAPAMDMASMQSAAGTAPVPVTIAVVGPASRGGATIAAPASIEPYLTQNIVARVPGLLTNFAAYTGDRVHAGEVVAYLEEPELQSDAQAASADAQAAQRQETVAATDAQADDADLSAKRERVRYWDAEIAREQMLLDAGAVSRREYQDERAEAAAARSAYRSAQARIAGAEAAIDSAHDQAIGALATARSRSIVAGYTRVVVPDDAFVVKRLVDPGVYVQAGTPILQVAVIDTLRVQAQVAQRDLPSIDIGTPMDVVLEGEARLQGSVTSISPVVDPLTHTAIVEAIVQNPGGALQPGGFAHVILHGRGAASVHSFAVPSAAVVGGATTAVWIDASGTAHRVSVSVLSDDGTTAYVSGPLHQGTRVIVTGASNLEEGQAVAGVLP